MGNSAAAIPAGILGAICVLMFAFIWWWFPRHYRKGMRMDMQEIEEDRRAREAYLARHPSMSTTISERQRDLEAGAANTGPVGEKQNLPPPMPRAYVAPVTPY